MNTNNNQQGYWVRTLRKTPSSNNPIYQTGKNIYIKVVGVQYEGRLEVVAKLKMEEQVLLRREPTNPYDYNAIRIERLTGEQIGYVKRTEAAHLAMLFDDIGEPIPGTISDLIPVSYRNRYPVVFVSFTIPDPNQNKKGDVQDDYTKLDL